MRSSTLLALSVVLLIACKACGQIDISVTKHQEVVGLKSPTLIGNRVLVESLEDGLTTKPVALLLIQAQSEDIRVEGSDIQRQDVAIQKVADGMYLLDAPGKTWVQVKEYIELEISGTKRRFLSDEKTIVVELGPPVPPVPPVPPPPAPGSCDAKTNSNFDGLSKRACEWVDQVVIANARRKRSELAQVYLDGAEKLSSGQYLTINAASDGVKADWSRVLDTIEMKQAWGAWSTKANEELASRWVDQSTNTAKRELMVQFFRALGEGLQP